MGRLPIVFLTFTFLCAATRIRADAGDELLISLQPVDGVLELRYTPPEGVRVLPFWGGIPNAHSRWRASMLKPADDCTALEENAVRLRDSPECRSAVFRIHPRVLAMNATYEPAQPISDGSGVLSYSGQFVVLVPGHVLHWRWLPPAAGPGSDGYVIHQGARSREAVDERIPAALVDAALEHRTDEAERQLGATQSVFMGRTPFLGLAGGTLVLDPALDAARGRRVATALERDVEALTQAYGRGPQGPFAVVAAWSDLPGFHGDTTAGRMMRLRLPSDASSMPGPALEHFVAHEVAHWWNAGVHRSDPATPWLHEGNAEWMATLLLHGAGQLDGAALRVEIERALDDCATARGARPAATLGQGRNGDDVYACGMTLMLLGQAAHGRGASPTTTLAGLYLPYDDTHLLDRDGFIGWADAGGALVQGHPLMERLLADPGVGFTSGLAEALDSVGLADGAVVTRSEQLPVGQQRRLGADFLQAVMKADCGGAVGFWTLDRGYRLDTGLHCQTLRVGQELRTVEGASLMADPLGAWAAAVRRCASAATFTVADADQVKNVVACPKALPPVPTPVHFHLREEALDRLGLADEHLAN